MIRRRVLQYVWVVLAALVTGPLVVEPAEAQITLRLRVNPLTVSFPDANPTTTPLIPGNQIIRVRVRVRNALSAESWSVTALAGGDLLSGLDAIPISNMAWTVTQAGRPCTCTCQAGTQSDAVPQLMLIGQGNTAGSGVQCRQSYRLSNSWAYNPGSYAQIATITLTAP